MKLNNHIIKGTVTPIIFCLITISIILVYSFYSNIYYLLAKDSNNNEGLCFFYNILNPNLHFWLTTFIYSIPSLFFLNTIMNNHFNKFDYLIKERLGTKKFIFNNFVSTFIKSFIFIFFLYIYILLFIHVVLTPLNFSYSEYIDLTNYSINIFTKNTFANLIIYMFCSSIGFSIFTIFILSIKNKFKQKYLFKISSLVLGILLSVIPIIVGNYLYLLFENDIFLKIFSTFLLPSLITPGIQGFGSYGNIINPYINYLLTLTFYILITIISTYFEYNGEYKYDF